MMLDTDGRIIYSNPAATKITGYLPEELLNKHLSVFYSNNDNNSKAEHDLSLSLKEGKFISEGWRIRKDGHSFWSEMIFSSLFNDEHKQIGYSCIFRDISEKKKREIELHESEERYRLMVKDVRDYAIFMLDQKGYILSWNEGARRTKGYTSDEIIGQHFSIFYIPEDLEDKKPERELKIAIETGKYEEEGWRKRKDGSLFWANVVITAVYNNSGVHIVFQRLPGI